MEKHNKIGLDCMSTEAIRNMFPIGTKVVVWWGVWFDRHQIKGVVTGYNFRTKPINNMVYVNSDIGNLGSLPPEDLEHDRSL